MIAMIGIALIDTRAGVRMTIIRRGRVAMIVTTTGAPTGITVGVTGMTKQPHIGASWRTQFLQRRRISFAGTPIPLRY
jgi:hypothetical protein